MPNLMNVGLGKDYTIKDYYLKTANVIGYKGKFYYNKSEFMTNSIEYISFTKNSKI